MKTYIWELTQKIVFRGWLIHENVYMGTDTDALSHTMAYCGRFIEM